MIRHEQQRHANLVNHSSGSVILESLRKGPEQDIADVHLVLESRNPCVSFLCVLAWGWSDAPRLSKSFSAAFGPSMNMGVFVFRYEDDCDDVGRIKRKSVRLFIHT